MRKNSYASIYAKKLLPSDFLAPTKQLDCINAVWQLSFSKAAFFAVTIVRSEDFAVCILINFFVCFALNGFLSHNFPDCPKIFHNFKPNTPPFCGPRFADPGAPRCRRSPGAAQRHELCGADRQAGPPLPQQPELVWGGGQPLERASFSAVGDLRRRDHLYKSLGSVIFAISCCAAWFSRAFFRHHQ